MVPYDKIKITLRREIIKIEKKKYTSSSSTISFAFAPQTIKCFLLISPPVKSGSKVSSAFSPSKQLSVYSCTIE
jgi:hypothetical protein